MTLLLPEDFGNYALVVSITSVCFLHGFFGLNDIVINRKNQFNLWRDKVYTLYVLIGVIGFILSILV